MLIPRELGTSAPRAGHEPVSDVHLVEDHERAYDVWKASGTRNRILVHVDGHLDFDWIADHPPEELLAARSSEELDRLLARARAWNLDGKSPGQQVGSANFIYPAIKEGIVRKFFWVVPDPFWATRAERQVIRERLEKLQLRRPADAGPIQVSETCMSFEVLGCPLIVCKLDHLPRFSEPVLLDIDVDYFVTWKPRGPEPYFEHQPVIPWIWPSEFLERLKGVELASDLVTIACSVNGGYTPVHYKYFGDVLREGLRDPDRRVGDEAPAGSAVEALREAARALHQGDMEEAREWWGKMVSRDPSYRTVYATPGWREEICGRWRSALGIYDQMVQMDPEWHVPYLGRGRMLWQLRRWMEAEQAFQKAASVSPGPTSATFWLGRCAFRRGDWEAARRHWRAAVEQNPQEVMSRYALAYLASKNGDPSEAIAHARQCVQLGVEGPAIHWLMARAARRLGRRRLCRRELRLWGRQLIQALWVQGRQRWRRLRGTGRETHGAWEVGTQANASVV